MLDKLKTFPDIVSRCSTIEKCQALKEISFVTECKKMGKNSWFLKLSQEIDALKLTEIWNLALPYAYSTDVHQERWKIGLYDGEIEDEYSHRIALVSPSFGHWKVDIIISDRPKGKLPKTVTGASPAYDLTKYSTKTDRIEFWK